MLLKSKHEYMELEDKGKDSYEKLYKLKERIKTGEHENLTDSETLNMLDKLTECMFYEVEVKNYDELESTMRTIRSLLDNVKLTIQNNVLIFYFELMLKYVNAWLYFSVGNNRQSADEFVTVKDLLQKVIDKVCNCEELEDEQRQYINLRCIECCADAIMVFSAVNEKLQVVETCKIMVDCIEGELKAENGEKYAKLYALDALLNVANLYLRMGDNGDNVVYYYEKTLRFSEELYKKCNDDIFSAYSLLIKFMYGGFELLTNNNTVKLIECEREIKSIRKKLEDKSLEAIITDCVDGVINLQKSLFYMSEDRNINEQKDAVYIAESGLELISSGFENLKNLYKNTRIYKKLFISKIMDRIYSYYISALTNIGKIYYFVNRMQDALEMFEKALELIGETEGKDEHSVLLIKFECCTFLGQIYMALYKNKEKSVFYYTQAADESDFAIETKNVFMLTNVVMSCMSLAEVFLHSKEKNNARKYAIKGLGCIDILMELQPCNEYVNMKNTLEKYKKRAERRFF